MATAVSLKSLATGTEWDLSGDALSGRPVFVYQRGTTTQVTVYQDAGLTTPYTQPLTTGADGTPGAIPGWVVANQSIDFVDMLTGNRTQAEALSGAALAGMVTASSTPAQSPGVRWAINVRDGAYGALGTGVAEPATPFQNAYLAATVLGGDVFIPAGQYYVNDGTHSSVFQLARDNARTGAKVRIVFDPGATIRLSALTPRLADFNKQADFDWFRNVEFQGNGATIDANNIGGIHHVLLGTLQAGAIQQYINFEFLEMSGFNVINTFTDATDGSTNLRHAVWISPLGNPTTDTYGQFCKFEDIKINPAGTAPDGSTAAGAHGGGGAGGITVGNAGATSKFHWDQLWIRRCYHDRGLITENYGGADSFYIGSRGVGGQGGMIDCWSRGAGDTAYEINGAGEGYVERCVAIDPANNGYLHRGANGGINPSDLGSVTTFEDCMTRKVARTGSVRHIKFGVDTAGDFDYGTVIVRGGGCAYERTDNADLSVVMASSPANYKALRFENVTLEIKAGPSCVNPSGTVLVTSPVYLDNGNGLFKVRGMNVILSGSVNVGVGNISRRGIDARGNWRLDIEDFNVDDSQTFTGGTPALIGAAIGTALAAGGGKSTVWGRIDKMRVGGSGGIGVSYGAFATQNITSGHPFEVTNLDCGDMAAGATPVSTSGASLAQIKARRVIPRGGFAFPSVASAATLTLPAYDVEGEITTVTGTTGVTAITASWAGRAVRLNLTGACTVTDNGTTLNTVGNYTGPGYLSLYCDGTNWIELGRSTP